MMEHASGGKQGAAGWVCLRTKGDTQDRACALCVGWSCVEQRGCWGVAVAVQRWPTRVARAGEVVHPRLAARPPHTAPHIPVPFSGTAFLLLLPCAHHCSMRLRTLSITAMSTM